MELDDRGRKAFAVAAFVVLGVVAPIYILIQLYRADFGTGQMLAAAAIMWGGLALGALGALAIVRLMRR